MAEYFLCVLDNKIFGTVGKLYIIHYKKSNWADFLFNHFKYRMLRGGRIWLLNYSYNKYQSIDNLNKNLKT